VHYDSDISVINPPLSDCVLGPSRTEENSSVDILPNADSSLGATHERTKKIKRIRELPVTLSGLLNALDGVAGQEDCILFATT